MYTTTPSHLLAEDEVIVSQRAKQYSPPVLLRLPISGAHSPPLPPSARLPFSSPQAHSFLLFLLVRFPLICSTRREISNPSAPKLVIYECCFAHLASNTGSAFLFYYVNSLIFFVQVASLKGALSASQSREAELLNRTQRLQEELDQARWSWSQEREMWARRHAEASAYATQLSYQLSALHIHPPSHPSPWSWVNTTPSHMFQSSTRRKDGESSTTYEDLKRAGGFASGWRPF